MFLSRVIFPKFSKILCKRNIGRSMPRKRRHPREPTNGSSAKRRWPLGIANFPPMPTNVDLLTQPIKSASDKKEYRLIRLQNGLTVLLVDSTHSPLPLDSDSETSDSNATSESDSGSSSSSSSSWETESSGAESGDDEEGEIEEKLAACGLCVGVGSFSDPDDVNGLAHFLEHMIFMGSEKYPNENEFDAYIKKSGGFDNADTDCEETSFYFEVATKHFDGALDRFSSLFVAPLMLREAMTREREAVDSEFQTKINSNRSRCDQLLASLGQEGHPTRIFTWGNLKTLKDNITDDELYEKVHEFRRRHYSAHRMTACLEAAMPLDELQSLAVRYFSAIPSNNLPGLDFSPFNATNAFRDEFHSKVFFVKAKGDMNRLYVTWCMPSLLDQYKCKPHHYVAHLLNHEGKGGLCSFLRQKLWALDVYAFTQNSGFEHNSLYTLFDIVVCLTDLGLEQIEKVLDALFAYLRLLQQQGAREEVFRELQDIAEAEFRFQTEVQAIDHVEEMIVNMRLYSPEDILTGTELYLEYNERQIQDVIDALNGPNFNLMLLTTKPFGQVQYEERETWFGTEYSAIDLPEEWKRVIEAPEKNPEFHMPEPNVFISKDFTILGGAGNGEVAAMDENGIEKCPKMILKNDTIELWYRLDDKFLLPHAYMNFYLISPLPLENTFNATLLNIYSLILKHQIAEELYPAHVANLRYEVHNSDKGIVLKCSGYNEKLHLIPDRILRKMKDFNRHLDENIFETMKRQLAKDYYNNFIKPRTLNKEIRLSVVQQKCFPSYLKRCELDRIGINDLRDFADAYLRQVRIDALIQGNLTEAGALAVAETLCANLGCHRIDDASKIESRANQLPLGKRYLRVKSFRPNDVNTVVTNFYQIGPSTLRITCLLDLLVMLLDEPLFDTLRTKEQLGYDVSTDLRDNFGVLGYSITVHSQENKFDAAVVDAKIEAFRAEFKETLKTMPAEDFETTKSSLIKLKCVADVELHEEVTRNWAEITTEEYVFDRHKREAECIRTISQAELLAFYEATMSEEKCRELSVQVIGDKEVIEDGQFEMIEAEYGLKYLLESDGGENLIGDIETFKRGLFTHPVIKTALN